MCQDEITRVAIHSGYENGVSQYFAFPWCLLIGYEQSAAAQFFSFLAHFFDDAVSECDSCWQQKFKRYFSFLSRTRDIYGIVFANIAKRRLYIKDDARLS